MSYTRFYGKDALYVYKVASQPYAICTGCGLVEMGSAGMVEDETHMMEPVFASRTDLIVHLKAHEAAGHDVNPKAYERLAAELIAWGDAYEAPLDRGTTDKGVVKFIQLLGGRIVDGDKKGEAT